MLWKKIVPRFGIPVGISSDKGWYFVAEVVVEISELLNITWELHSFYGPQTIMKVKRMNQTVKTQLIKICQETSMD